ncbi:MAG: RodZ domain-containing protein [Parvibaculum sp.]|uniref:helix-turn-helix domain-containing protein n=1 Tax=Parvibaculum sp. TaxID=2024848 RepID=UPI0034A026B7
MTKVTMLPTEDRSDARRRLHLRDITNELPDAADTVGAELRNARLRRGEDLRAIAQCLRISRSQLEAIEEGRNAELPARAYAIGFVRSYAEYLGLDSRHVVERYKAELDNAAATAADLSFPDIDEERRLPKGTFLIVLLVVAAGLYGGWLLSKSTDEMMAARGPATLDLPATADAPAESADAVAPRGDSASASTPGADDVPVVRVAPAPSADAVLPPQSVYEPAPLNEEAAEAAAAEAAVEEMELAALSEEVSSELPPVPDGTPYGAENVDGRVVVRARRNGAWIRVEDAAGKVLIERVFQIGDSYRAPSQPGVILVARDASAFEIMVDGQPLGLAGPSTLVLTGKSLYAADLLAAMPKPAVAGDVSGETPLE